MMTATKGASHCGGSVIGKWNHLHTGLADFPDQSRLPLLDDYGFGIENETICTKASGFFLAYFDPAES